MTSSILLVRRKFGTGPAFFEKMEMLVVTESILPARLDRDDSFERSSSLRKNPAIRRGKAHRADEPSGSRRFGYVTHRLNKFSIVCSVPLFSSSLDP